VLLVPYIVRARRVGGKPRQQTVLILPGIRSCCLADPLVLAHWWIYVDGRLDWLANPMVGSMTPQEAAAMRARLEETVPRASPEVVAQVKAEQEAREAESRERAKAFAEILGRAFAPNSGAPPALPLGCPLHMHMHLSVLGLRWPCTREEVKAAYRSLATQHHPDRGGDPEQFKKVQAAHDRFLQTLDQLGVR
jgi:hypothetical protein